MMRICQAALFTSMLAVAISCESSPSANEVEIVGDSRAFATWAPAAGECSAEIHNSYFEVGPDGKRYPTWHPLIDPATGCSFGHEHGRDPRGSALYDRIKPILFGYANEQQDIADPGMIRHEDHVGHKIEWENGMDMTFEGAAGQILDVQCDLFTKLHQGSHSKDAFTNNLHEVIYAIRCTDRTEMHLTMLTAFGRPGELIASCDRERVILVGPASPVNSPVGGGKRAIPDRQCVEEFMLVPPGQRSNYNAALRESWEANISVRAQNGRTIASADPYFQVLFPSRFFDPTKPDNMARPIDVCYEVTPEGRAAREGLCASSTNNGAIDSLLFNDPQSLFNGVRRFVDVNGNRISNSDGPEIWYSDPLGRNARREPFPGSIRQYIARVNNNARVNHGPLIGNERNYGGTGVRAPN